MNDTKPEYIERGCSIRDTSILKRFQQKFHRLIITMYGPIFDLKGAVLAENIVLQIHENCPDTVVVTFDFLCSNCGSRHWATEIDSVTSLFSTIGWRLECGWVRVRMPWAVTPSRDLENICERENEDLTSEEISGKALMNW